MSGMQGDGGGKNGGVILPKKSGGLATGSAKTFETSMEKGYYRTEEKGSRTTARKGLMARRGLWYQLHKRGEATYWTMKDKETFLNLMVHERGEKWISKARLKGVRDLRYVYTTARGGSLDRQVDVPKLVNGRKGGRE